MRLKGFSVSNYKIFENEFKIDFSEENISILTGRNNTGKSTILEAINHFYKKASKTNDINIDCFSKDSEPIKMEAVFKDENEEIFIIEKVYHPGLAPKFYMNEKELKKGHENLEILELIYANPPFYITPNMFPESMNKLIQEIYANVIKTKLEMLEKSEVTDEEKELQNKYKELKKSVPQFLEIITKNIDESLNEISTSVSSDLQKLFSNEQLSIQVSGGESEGFSPNDIVKSTTSKVLVEDSNKQTMLLENQGTGLQRMSLIYLIQKLISQGFLGDNDNKLLLIDEPEAFLHPEAVRSLSNSLYSIGEEMPLIISTHSPVLIDLSKKHTHLQVFRVLENKALDLFKSQAIKFEEDDIKNMKIMNYVDAHVSEFFFADKVIIVEGDTEYLAFQHLAREKEINVHILRARGKDTICTLMKILNQFNTEYSVLHDVDNHDKYEDAQYRSQKTKCKKIFRMAEDKEEVRVYCANKTFEVAIGHGEIASRDKTSFIFNLIHGSENEDIRLMESIENLFLNILNQEEKNEEFTGEFFFVNNDQEIEDFFPRLQESSLY